MLGVNEHLFLDYIVKGFFFLKVIAVIRNKFDAEASDFQTALSGDLQESDEAIVQVRGLAH